MSGVPASDTLPDHLKARILAQADDYFRGAEHGRVARDPGGSRNSKAVDADLGLAWLGCGGRSISTSRRKYLELEIGRNGGEYCDPDPNSRKAFAGANAR
jgi:hypothetical protein